MAIEGLPFLGYADDLVYFPPAGVKEVDFCSLSKLLSDGCFYKGYVFYVSFALAKSLIFTSSLLVVVAALAEATSLFWVGVTA